MTRFDAGDSRLLDDLRTRTERGMPDMQLDPADVLEAGRRRTRRIRTARGLGAAGIVVAVLIGLGAAGPQLVPRVTAALADDDRDAVAPATDASNETSPHRERTADTGPSLDPAQTFGATVQAAAPGLADGVMPDGFTYIDSVDVDGSGMTSNVYASPDGPTGPTLYLHTGIGRDYTSERESGLSWEAATGFGDRYRVRTATHAWSGVTWAFVDVDSDDGSSVHLIGEGVPLTDLLATTHRLLASLDPDAG